MPKQTLATAASGSPVKLHDAVCNPEILSRKATNSELDAGLYGHDGDDDIFPRTVMRELGYDDYHAFFPDNSTRSREFRNACSH